MNSILVIMQKIVLSEYYRLVYVFIIILIIFMPQIISQYVVKGINKIMTSRYEIANELKDDLIREYKLRERYTEFFNHRVKAQIYFLIGLTSFFQLITLLAVQDIANVDMNICLLTLAISFMEFRDNKRISQKIDDEMDIEVSEVITAYLGLQEMVIADSVEEYLIKEDALKAGSRS